MRDPANEPNQGTSGAPASPGPPARAADPGAPDPQGARVLAEVESLLADLHARARRSVGLHSNLTADLGLDSLAMVELHGRLEQAFGVRLPEEVLATASTPADWLAAIQRARGAPAPALTPAPAASSTPRAAGEPWPASATTLTEALDWHEEIHPDLVTIRVVDGRGSAEEITYAKLAAEARAVAQGLLARGLDRAERVAIMLPTGRAYFAVFLGVLLAGGVPVPLYPPAQPAMLEEHLGKQARLLRNAGAVALVTVPEAALAARLMRAQVPTLRGVHTPEALARNQGQPQRMPAIAGEDLALIQYTSGSTGDPKGVVLTHAQLLANIAAMGEAVDVTTSDVFVSWLPLYHDMGLIAAWHAPLFFGLPLVISSPLTFLARPASWLEAISRFGGTLSAAPNFAYASCVERVTDAELATLDLSSWRVAFNGSEPVSAAVIERFIERFGCCGFRREAMCPAYGLAEVGVGATFTPLGRGPRIDTVSRGVLARSGRAVPVAATEPDAMTVVSCGVPLPGFELRIVDEHGRELPERREGEVECRSPSATAGYFANEAATAALWHHGWLDTGDRGYIADGELFLTGRSKDVVIRAGRNLHPEELETALGELHGVRRGGAAVFASSDPRLGTERLVVAVETELEAPAAREELSATIGRQAVELLGAPPDEIVLLRPGALLRTASGKIRRRATAEAFEAGTLGRAPRSLPLQLVRFAWLGARPAGRRVLDALAMWSFALYAWMAVGLIGAPLWVVMALPLPLGVRWWLTRGAARMLRAATGIELEVEGELPSDGPAVIVSNHPSFIDGLVLLLVLATPAVFVASTDLERQPIAGSFLRRLGCTFVTRDQADRTAGAVAQIVAVLRGGQRLVVFPEGSITRAPGLRPFHLGAFAAAAGAGCPVIPFGIHGTRDVLRPGTLLPRRGAIRVRIGEAIFPAGNDFRAQVELRDRARRAVAELSGEPDRG